MFGISSRNFRQGSMPAEAALPRVTSNALAPLPFHRGARKAAVTTERASLRAQ